MKYDPLHRLELDTAVWALSIQLYRPRRYITNVSLSLIKQLQFYTILLNFEVAVFDFKFEVVCERINLIAE